MYLIRDVFHCKPGKARALAEMLRKTIPSMQQEDGFVHCQVMVDLVSSYWTVVLQSEVAELSGFEHHMNTFSARPEVRQAVEGYMDLVVDGYREIYWVL